MLLPLLLVAFLAVLPFMVAVVLVGLALLWLRRGGQRVPLWAVSSGRKRLRWPHTERVLVGDPILLNLALIVVLLGSPRVLMMAGGAVEAGSSAAAWRSCVRGSSGLEGAACTAVFSGALSQSGADRSADTVSAAWTTDGPLSRELDRIGSECVTRAAAPLWTDANPYLSAVADQWDKTWRQIEAGPSGERAAAVHAWVSWVGMAT